MFEQSISSSKPSRTNRPDAVVTGRAVVSAVRGARTACSTVLGRVDCGGREGEYDAVSMLMLYSCMCCIAGFTFHKSLFT